MGYLIDRQRALSTHELVALARESRQRARSRLILRDNSLYRTPTRPQTIVRRMREGPAAIIHIAPGKRLEIARVTDA